MSDFSKQAHLSKNKKQNPKKMTQVEYELYVDFVNEKSKGLCQCGCGRKADDIHHSVFGAGGRDDRYIVAISRHCHTLIHATNYKMIDEKSRLTLLFKKVGKQNFKDYTA